MIDMTKIEARSFMETLEVEGISKELREYIMDKAGYHYETIMKSVIENFVPVPDLPFFINTLRNFVIGFKMAAPEQFEKALQILPEQELQQIAEENDSGVMS